jgi:hypothetical protein
MRAIIIDHKDALALLDQLKLETMDASGRDYPTVEIEVRRILDKKLGPLSDDKAIETSGAVASLLCGPSGEIVKEIHRRFHFVVVRWLQEQGASCVR